MKPIFVVKRDGSREPLDISKVQTQITRACEGITNVSESMIELRASIQFEDGMTTEKIDKYLLDAMINLINVNDDPETNHTNYQYVAGKQRLMMLRKDVYQQYEPPRLYDIVRRNVEAGLYTPELLEWYSEDDWNKMEGFIDHEKDEKYSYAALEQLISKYLVRNRVTEVIYETPQVRYMIAAAVCFHMEGKNGKRLGYVRDYYEAASTGAFTLATPVLAGLGTKTKQFSSCFPAGQKVWTATGERSIEDVRVGEAVLTHDGSFQRVLAIREQSAPQKNFIQINNVYSLNGEFECTEDHLVRALVRSHPDSRKKWSVPHWVEAGALNKSDFVQIPFNKHIDGRSYVRVTDLAPEILSSLALCSDDMLRKPTTDPLRRSGDYDDKVLPVSDIVNLTPDLFRMLGYYAAEGHANKNTHSIGFTLATSEEAYLSDIETTMKALFGVHGCKDVRSDNSTSLVFHSLAVKTLFLNLVGTGFERKSLSDTVMRATKENQEAFLTGLIRGDGCVHSSGLTIGMSNRHLVRQVSQIMLRCGLSPVLGVKTAEAINRYKTNRKPDSKTIVTARDSYTITMGLSGNYAFLKKLDDRNRIAGPKKETHLHGRWINGDYFARIRSTSRRPTHGALVYDLQVDNVPSFTVNGVGVHNCVLISSDDTLKSIFATGEMMADYASKRAGIGVELGRMRGEGAPIRGGEIKHTGIIPFLKKWFGDLRSCSQGGIRNASATMNMPIWHIQFADYIVLKNNQGTEEARVRHLDYCVQLNAFFFRRFKEKGNITLFDPWEVPHLYDAFFSDTALFEKLYVEAENNPDITRKEVIPAEKLFKEMLLKERTDTGRIYLMFVDNVMRNTPFDVTTHPIVQTNLCVEILLPTRPFQRIEDEAGRIALCTLGSINWGKFKLPGEMRGACQILVRALSNILGYQDFLSVQSRLSNEEFEPLGVGVTNLAYWHAKRGLKYGEEEALGEVKRWMEHQAYFLTEATVDLAAEKGPCRLSHTTRYGKGEFPWENRAPGVDELADFEPSLDWEPLRERMIRHGVRNATLMAIAPVESSSVVIDSTNGIELPMQLISVKESKAGSFVQVVPEYKKLKNKYQLMWDQTDCIDYIKTAAVLAAFCDQSISTNTFYSPKHFPDKKVPVTLVAKNLMLAHKWGVKTFYYSLMEKLGIKAGEEEKLPEDIVITPAVEEIEEEDCEACKL